MTYASKLFIIYIFRLTSKNLPLFTFVSSCLHPPDTPFKPPPWLPHLLENPPQILSYPIVLTKTPSNRLPFSKLTLFSLYPLPSNFSGKSPPLPKNSQKPPKIFQKLSSNLPLFLTNAPSYLSLLNPNPYLSKTSLKPNKFTHWWFF